MAGSEATVDPPRRDLTWVAALVVGIGVFAIYRATLLPGLAAWDTGEAQTVLPILGTMHPTGFPAYTIIGWLASIVLSPLGSPAFTINLLSAILVATAVGLTVVVARSLRVPLAVGMAAAVGFGLSPIVWRVATGADAHALHAVLLVAIVGLLLRWERFARDAAEHPDDPRLRGRADRAIVLAAAVFGVSVANHGLTLLLIPAVGLFVLAVEPRIVFRPKVVAAALGACIGVAALLYLELPLRAGPFRAPLVYGHPETIRGFLEVVLATQFQGSVTRAAARRRGPGRGSRGARVRAVRRPAPPRPVGLPRGRRPSPAVRAAVRRRHDHHMRVRRLVRQRRHPALLHSALRSSPGPGSRSSAARSSSGSSRGPTRRPDWWPLNATG